MKSKRDILVILLSIISMLIGGVLYLFYRPHSLMMFSWLKYIHCEQMFKRQYVSSGSLLSEFIIYSLPSGLWIFSGMLLFGLIWRFYAKCFFLYSTIIITGSILFEFLQMNGIILGKFDVYDILSLGFFGLSGYLFYLLIIRREKNEE